MKKGVKRDLVFVGALLGAWVAAAVLAGLMAYLGVGPPPADILGRELYAKALKKLFGVYFGLGTGIVIVIYLWRAGWLSWKQRLMKTQHQADNSDIAIEGPERAQDSNLPPWTGWGILLGFAVIMAIVIAIAALSQD